MPFRTMAGTIIGRPSSRCGRFASRSGGVLGQGNLSHKNGVGASAVASNMNAGMNVRALFGAR